MKHVSCKRTNISKSAYRVLRAVGLLALAIGLCLINPPSAAAQCDPRADEVAFFEHSDFRGKCVIRGAGEYARATQIGLANDSISSIKVGANVQALVCPDSFFAGQCELFEGDDPNLGNNKIKHDRITSAKVQLRGVPTQCSPGPRQVAFFQHSNFRGVCVVRDPGRYSRAVNIGLANDTISSVRVGSGAQTYVCGDAFYEGRCELLTADDDNLNGNVIGNDNISSAKVQRRGESLSCEPLAGQVAFFQHSNFGGACEVHGIGDYASSTEIGLRNDTISSIKVGTEVQAVLCRDSGFGGNCQSFTENDPNLGNDRIGQDQVSSARVQIRGQQDCLPAEDQVAVFAHRDFLAPCRVLNIGSYASAFSIGLQNDSISSVRVGRDTQLILCRDRGFVGSCELFRGNDSNLGNDSIGHDSASSLKVQPRGTEECPPGSQEVAFFMHGDFLAPCVTKGIGDYRDASEIGLKDNSISSIRVGSDVQACACVTEEFGDTCEVFTNDDAGLGDNFPKFTSGNDIISSARVQPLGAECRANPPTMPPQGFSQLAVFNCHAERRLVHLWTRDITAGSSFVQRGTLPAQWSNAGCPGNNAPFIIPLTDGHLFQFVAVDPDMIACGGSNDPQRGPCQRDLVPSISGDVDGPSADITVN